MKGMKKQITDHQMEGKLIQLSLITNYTQSNHQIHPKQTFKVMARKHARKTNFKRHEKQTP